MVALSIAGVRIAGICCAIPTKEGAEIDAQVFGAESAQKISSATGVYSRHVVELGASTSDLCQASAEQVLNDLGWDRESIQALVFVSQTPDYLLPATSCCLQKLLGLVVMYQANLFLLRHLGKQLSIPADKLPISLDRYGNTSSASIPITIADQLATRSAHEPLRLLLLGFGVGYSWGAVALTLGPIPIPHIITLGSSLAKEPTEQRQSC